MRVFGYNIGMNWVRKAFVGFLAVVLFFALLGSAYAYSLHSKLSNPANVEKLLAESKIYDHAVSAALSQAQDDSSKNGGEISVSLKSSVAQQAAQAAFPASLVQSSSNTFIDSNYKWLAGKTAKPDFSIDLTKAKQEFATSVGNYVIDHLKGLSVCTPEQLAQLQIPVDPLSVTCRPESLDPKTEGDRVANEVANSSFLSKPVVTADTLGQDQDSGKPPYYQKLSGLPRAYQLGNKLPLILGAVAIISALGIIFIHPTRRKGLRRTGVVLAVSGVVLIVSKLLADKAVNEISDRVLSGSTKDQLHQPLVNFLQNVESQVTQSNMIFGIIFVVLGVAVIAYLLLSGRERKPKQPRQARQSTVNTGRQPIAPDQDDDFAPGPQRPAAPMPTDISSRLRQPKPTGPPTLGPAPRTHSQPGQPQGQQPQQPRPPKRPRLIQ